MQGNCTQIIILENQAEASKVKNLALIEKKLKKVKSLYLNAFKFRIMFTSIQRKNI